MSKKIQVLIVFEFDGVDDLEGDKADEIVRGLTQSTEEWAEGFVSGHKPLAVWVEEVFRDSEKWVLAEEVVR
jgi:hypothetical protein